MAPPFVVGLLAFRASTYGFVPDLLKFLLDGKMLFNFLYNGRLKTWFAVVEEVLRPISVSVEVLLPQLPMLIAKPNFV